MIFLVILIAQFICLFCLKLELLTFIEAGNFQHKNLKILILVLPYQNRSSPR
jgi:hypothetical protein